jgi:hypothetical protein
VKLCTECAHLIRDMGAAACPRCGSPLRDLTQGSLDETAATGEARCAGRLHYLPEDAGRCVCGRLGLSPTQGD